MANNLGNNSLIEDLPGNRKNFERVRVDEPNADVDKILAERGSRYGKFSGHAAVTQDMKNMIRNELHLRNKTLASNQMEALDMICHKIGRIINGDPNYADSWIDIAGYAKLVADQLEGKDI